MSMPPLVVDDLPTPEEVFKVSSIGMSELIFLVLGPSLVAVAISVGSGEWLLGPLTVGQYGFRGIGWVVLCSLVLQVFYNVELARFTIATGESPFTAFGRIPPGRFIWVPLTFGSFFFSFVLGGWTVSAGASLFALLTGRPHVSSEIDTVRLMGVGLLFSTFLFVVAGRRIIRSLEISQGIFVTFMMVGLVFVTFAVVPLQYIIDSFLSLVTFSYPPAGTDPSLLGALAGFTALAAGLNYMFIGFYRDKGYGMGFRTGFISGILGGEKCDIKSGRIFPDDEKNRAIWKRWFRILLIDQWGLYFTGCLVGIMMPSIMVGYLSSLPGAVAPSRENILVYAAVSLGKIYGPILFGWAMLMGFIILYTTQVVVLELLSRAFTDSVYGGWESVRKWVGHDPRRVYYPAMLAFLITIGVIIHQQLPVELILMSANLSNLSSLIFPLALLYLNRRLPQAARCRWWAYPMLFANALFFGFFFINFLTIQITGAPLVRF